MPEQKGLYKKLAEIMSEVGYIQKNGKNNHFGYTYATESDVQDAVRDKMSQRHLMMIPNVTDTALREITTRKGNTEYVAKVTITYKIVDGETGEEMQFNMEGEGQDPGDKAIYKAISGTQKYAIMKLFMIPTGDDPERDHGDEPAGSGSGKGGSGKQNGKPQTEAEKKAADKAFFDRRDELKNRIAKLAVEKQSSPKDITDYLVNKANKILEKSHKSINSINIGTAEKIMISLEKEAKAKGKENGGQPGPEDDLQMLNERTNQPR